MKFTYKVFAGALLLLMMAGPAYPQRKEILQLQADVIRLSQQITQLQNSVDEKNSVVQGLVEKVFDQVNTLSSTLERMNQVVDSVRTSNDKTAGDLRTIVGSLSSSVEQLNEGLTSVRTQLNSVSQQITTMKTSSEPLATPEDIMRTAVTDYLVGNYDLAISGFREYLSKYPADARAPEAQQYLGDAYFNQKKFDQAIIEYDLVLQKYPDSDKTRAALYKKGLALAELGQSQQALTILRKVVADFPNTSEATGAAERIKDLSRPTRRR